MNKSQKDPSIGAQTQLGTEGSQPQSVCTSTSTAPTTATATPGPWRATCSYGEATDEPWLIWSVPRDRAIAQCYRISESGDDNAKEQAANARIIASAPDLLNERDELRSEYYKLQRDCVGWQEARREAQRDCDYANAEVERLRAACQAVLRGLELSPLPGTETDVAMLRAALAEGAQS